MENSCEHQLVIADLAAGCKTTGLYGKKQIRSIKFKTLNNTKEKNIYKYSCWDDEEGAFVSYFDIRISDL